MNPTMESQDRELYYHDIYEVLYFHIPRDLYIEFIQNLGKDLDFELLQDIKRNLNENLFYKNLYLYLDQMYYINPQLLIHQDSYRYMDTNLHSSNFSQFGKRFDKELSVRIEFVTRMKEAKIFKDVDLDRMVQRINEEREFIKAAGVRKSIKPPVESILDTWLSVMQITNDMISISKEELDNCYLYLRAVDLIIECKETAGRVSPKVWEKIEKGLLSVKSLD